MDFLLIAKFSARELFFLFTLYLSLVLHSRTTHLYDLGDSWKKLMLCAYTDFPIGNVCGIVRLIQSQQGKDVDTLRDVDIFHVILDPRDIYGFNVHNPFPEIIVN